MLRKESSKIGPPARQQDRTIQSPEGIQPNGWPSGRSVKLQVGQRIPPQRPSKVPDGTTGDAPAITPVDAGGVFGKGDGAAGAACWVAVGGEAWATSVADFAVGLPAGAGCAAAAAGFVAAAAAVCAGVDLGFAVAGAAVPVGAAAPRTLAAASIQCHQAVFVLLGKWKSR